jgi:transposase
MEVFPMVRSTTPNPVVTFAGIDYHRKFSMVALGDANGKVVSIERVPNDKHTIRQFFESYGKLKCAVESCRGYEWFVDLLREMGLEVHLCNAHEVKLIAHSRCKTDKVDARILMELLAIGFLPTCYLPSAEERMFRERLRWRCSVVRNATRIKLRIHALLDKENLGLSLGPNLFGKSGKTMLKTVKLSAPGRQELLEQQLQLLEQLEEVIKKEDAWVKKTVKDIPDARLLMSIPGIGEFSSLVILAELGKISRFKRSAQVVNFAGLTPSIAQSGETKRTGRITKIGSSLLRWIMIQDAWRAISNYEIRCHFASVSRRCGRHAAIISVARKLLEIAYRVLRDQKPFDPNLVGAKRA